MIIRLNFKKVYNKSESHSKNWKETSHLLHQSLLRPVHVKKDSLIDSHINVADMNNKLLYHVNVEEMITWCWLDKFVEMDDDIIVSVLAEQVEMIYTQDR
jgi:hypothetical protein